MQIHLQSVNKMNERKAKLLYKLIINGTRDFQNSTLLFRSTSQMAIILLSCNTQQNSKTSRRSDDIQYDKKVYKRTLLYMMKLR